EVMPSWSASSRCSSSRPSSIPGVTAGTTSERPVRRTSAAPPRSERRVLKRSRWRRAHSTFDGSLCAIATVSTNGPRGMATARQDVATRQLIRAQRRAVVVVRVETADELARIGCKQLVDARCPEQIGRGVVREHETPAAVLHRDGLAEVAEDRVQALLGGLEL